MDAFLIAVAGLVMVTIPRLLTLWHRYLIYRNSPFTPNGPTPHAYTVYKTTVQSGYIKDRWDNYRIRRNKKASTVLGIALIALAFILSFDCRPPHFFLTINTILCGALWIYLEYKTMIYCFKHFMLSKSTLIVLAICAPVLIVGIMVVILYSLLKIIQMYNFECDLLTRYTLL